MAKKMEQSWEVAGGRWVWSEMSERVALETGWHQELLLKGMRQQIPGWWSSGKDQQWGWAFLYQRGERLHNYLIPPCILIYSLICIYLCFHFYSMGCDPSCHCLVWSLDYLTGDQWELGRAFHCYRVMPPLSFVHLLSFWSSIFWIRCAHVLCLVAVICLRVT